MSNSVVQERVAQNMRFLPILKFLVHPENRGKWQARCARGALRHAAEIFVEASSGALLCTSAYLEDLTCSMVHYAVSPRCAVSSIGCEVETKPKSYPNAAFLR